MDQQELGASDVTPRCRETSFSPVVTYQHICSASAHHTAETSSVFRMHATHNGCRPWHDQGRSAWNFSENDEPRRRSLTTTVTNLATPRFVKFLRSRSQSKNSAGLIDALHILEITRGQSRDCPFWEMRSAQRTPAGAAETTTARVMDYRMPLQRANGGGYIVGDVARAAGGAGVGTSQLLGCSTNRRRGDR